MSRTRRLGRIARALGPSALARLPDARLSCGMLVVRRGVECPRHSPLRRRAGRRQVTLSQWDHRPSELCRARDDSVRSEHRGCGPFLCEQRARFAQLYRSTSFGILCRCSTAMRSSFALLSSAPHALRGVLTVSPMRTVQILMMAQRRTLPGRRPSVKQRPKELPISQPLATPTTRNARSEPSVLRNSGNAYGQAQAHLDNHAALIYLP